MALPDSTHRRILLDERCARHQFEAGIDCCRQCGLPFCGECLVYSFGDRQPPFCIPCALAAAGVRSGAARAPVVPKKELRRREKEARRAAKDAVESAAKEAAAPAIDWSLPLNGNGSAPVNGNGQNGNGSHPGMNGNGDGEPYTAPASDHDDDAPPPPPTPSGGDAYPSFEDAPSSSRPQAPATPPKTAGRTGLFGRKKSKVVPF